MKYIFLFSCLLGLSLTLNAQKFTGQWKGGFGDKSEDVYGWGGTECDYVLELKVNGSRVSGYSYTYFSDAGQKYYTICKIVGTLNYSKKTVEIRETERTKTNVPHNITNCFQVHKLSYRKEGADEILEGSWIPAPNQNGNCGFGYTKLVRRSLVKSYPRFSSTASNKRPTSKTTKAIAKTKAPVKKPVTAAVKKPTPPTKPAVVAKPSEPVVVIKRNDSNQKGLEPNKNIVISPKIKPDFVFEKRSNSLLKTLLVESSSIQVKLYDNGEIDGDSVSVFYNNELILSHKKLTDQAISFTLPIADNDEVNELVMYAENLGKYPPNTALMIVTDGVNRYEVRISSDLQKSGSIRFVKKK